MRDVATLVLPSGTDPADLVRVPRVRASADALGATTDAPRIANELPLLLAGPVLRWAAPDRVVVWLVTSERLRVRGTIVDPRDTTRVLGEATGSTGHWARRLYVTKVAITPTSGSFPDGAVLAYDLEFSPPRGYAFTDEGGFVTRDEIAYGDYPLPTFVLGEGPGASRLRLAHASCRKPHADGEDAMLRMDRDLAAWAGAERPPAEGSTTWESERPRALLLTGDQLSLIHI